MDQIYWGLRENKWQEAIDGEFIPHGKDVFEFGFHHGCAEPGYLDSHRKVWDYISDNLGTRTSVPLYLEVHRLVCSHFLGKETNTVMDRSEAGRFRDRPIKWKIKYPLLRFFTEEEREKISTELFGILQVNEKGVCLYYNEISPTEIKARFSLFLLEYHEKIETAKNEDAKLFAIAEFTQRCQRLHTTSDGCGRLDTLFLNKHLVENGFTPVIINSPYISSLISVEQYVQEIKKGMMSWRLVAENKKLSLPLVLREVDPVKREVELLHLFRSNMLENKLLEAREIMNYLPLHLRDGAAQVLRTYNPVDLGDFLLSSGEFGRAYKHTPTEIVKYESMFEEFLEVEDFSACQRMVDDLWVPEWGDLSGKLFAALIRMNRVQEAEKVAKIANIFDPEHQTHRDRALRLIKQTPRPLPAAVGQKKLLKEVLDKSPSHIVEAQKIACTMQQGTRYYSRALFEVAKAWIAHGEFRLATEIAKAIFDPYYRTHALDLINYTS